MIFIDYPFIIEGPHISVKFIASKRVGWMYMGHIYPQAVAKASQEINHPKYDLNIMRCDINIFGATKPV